jgi:hypothetical protein
MSNSVIGKYTIDQLSELVEKIERVGGQHAVDRFLRDELILREADLFKERGQVEIGKISHFSCDETFLADAPPVRAHQLYGHFPQYFAGIREYHIPARQLKFYTLGRSATDKTIADHLGSSGTVSLAHIWYLLSRQQKGQKGTLLIEGVNLFYVRHRGKTRTVWLSWVRNSGWKVVAESFQKIQWSAGVRVFSRR